MAVTNQRTHSKPKGSALTGVGGGAVTRALTLLLCLGVGLHGSARPAVVSASGPVRPMTASSSFTFGAAGDYGDSSRVTAVLRAMAQARLKFALAIGDLSMSEITPESAWCSYVKSNIGSLPFELLSGNHESDGVSGLIDNFAACLPNQMADMVGTYAKEYYFDYPIQHPLARFIMISPGLNFTYGGPYNYSKGGADYDWVANAIDSARAAGIKWIIVANHKVCLSAGGSTCDGGTDILNLLVSKKVDIILMGHDHIYQRSKQLALSTDCPALDPSVYNSACVANDGYARTYHAGAGTIVNGLGTGGDGPDFGYVWTRADTPYFARFSGYNIDVRKGFEKFTVTSASITAQFEGVNPVGGPTSTFTDSYTITSNRVTPLSPALNSDGTIFENNLDPGPPGTSRCIKRLTNSLWSGPIATILTEVRAPIPWRLKARWRIAPRMP